MLTAVQTAAAVADGSLTARAAAEEALARIAEREPKLNALRVIRDEKALAEADAVDARSDLATLPLAGVPIIVKDNVAVAGESTNCGSLAVPRTLQPEDHEVVRRLRAAGAVIVGISNVPEFCVFGTTDSAEGITRNPWDVSRTPGGSSGGSAAAVGSGMVAIAHGNDGMGSIRIPAACTGLVGIKPGLGVVVSELGNGSWFDMAENGPLATTVADCALMFSVMAGDPSLAAVGVMPGLRVGVSVKPPQLGLPVDKHWASAARSTGDLLAGAGHSVRAAEVRYPLRFGPASLARWFAGTQLDISTLPDPSTLSRRTKRQAMLGRLVLAVGGPRDGAREAWRRMAEEYFADVDVLVTPTLAQPPIEALAWSERGWLANVVSNVRYAPFAAPWNLLGWPAMAVPAGVHPGGLPLSVQLVARPGQEATLLAVAAQLEQLRPWPRVAPAYG
ncbi:amidase [Jatrophihabitans sp. GAS493]|uniref:amidase n=1 Tax=Jatrophihabitans sp. GAS493 TaxID=1907575 RepID=UPI000BB906E1|nr:amidase family protein [Jatrophihabitans sp. GAS493]SOD75098.1 amidase [Jatrophihabitans sp. GAS493]